MEKLVLLVLLVMLSGCASGSSSSSTTPSSPSTGTNQPNAIPTANGSTRRPWRKTLIPNDQRSLRTVGWRGVAMVVLQDDDGNQWLIDAVTGGSPVP